jgi:hypothetical protein
MHNASIILNQDKQDMISEATKTIVGVTQNDHLKLLIFLTDEDDVEMPVTLTKAVRDLRDINGKYHRHIHAKCTISKDDLEVLSSVLYVWYTRIPEHCTYMLKKIETARTVCVTMRKRARDDKARNGVENFERRLEEAFEAHELACACCINLLETMLVQDAENHEMRYKISCEMSCLFLKYRYETLPRLFHEILVTCRTEKLQEWWQRLVHITNESVYESLERVLA